MLTTIAAYATFVGAVSLVCELATSRHARKGGRA